jgi:hypothetical protein
VFEEAPGAPAVDTALTKVASVEEALASLDTGGISIGRSITHTDVADIEPAPLPRARLVAIDPDDDSSDHTPAPDHITSEIAAQVPDEGTPLDGVRPSSPRLGVNETNFAAGEIDVPTPPPDRAPTPSVELASNLLDGTPDPDTGSRTPPIERR